MEGFTHQVGFVTRFFRREKDRLSIACDVSGCLLPLYPLDKIAVRIPLFANPLANAMTSGVFPVPPTVMLPTLMTGQGRRFDLLIPR